MSSGKCKLKQQGDTTIYLLVWLKFKTLTAPSADEVVKQQKFSYISGGDIKW